ncbi:2-oxoacid ferredoxin oxidoreductase, partial [Candidatus Gottesmanbacteria bacterium]|nr:2-oxoacid ferredoxin oxidoreductase [Candidatus Gottesmanbacteria bacterium]
FVAQGFSGDINHLTTLIEQGIKHRGFSLVNVFQPCVTFNPESSYAWYRERIYKLGDDYNTGDKKIALEKAMEVETKIPVGVIYKEERLTYTESLLQLAQNSLVEGRLEIDMEKFISEFV